MYMYVHNFRHIGNAIESQVFFRAFCSTGASFVYSHPRISHGRIRAAGQGERLALLLETHTHIASLYHRYITYGSIVHVRKGIHVRMWQSHVEIELYYSVAYMYFDRVTAFKVPYL